MRLEIRFVAERPLLVPLHYNHLLQGFIYHHLDPQLASWLHHEAYSLEHKHYKMFVFSRLEGSYNLRKDEAGQKWMHFHNPSLEFRSINPEIVSALAECLLNSDAISLGKNHCQVVLRNLPDPQPDMQRPLLVRADSPITLHGNPAPDEEHSVHYFHPFETAWQQGLLENLANKARALQWQDAPSLEHSRIRSVQVSHKDKAIVRYKDFWLRGWRGLYSLQLPEPYFWLAYHSGLGVRNAQGFGFIRLLDSSAT